jgi:hypothetical protein
LPTTTEILNNRIGAVCGFALDIGSATQPSGTNLTVGTRPAITEIASLRSQ